MAVRSAYFAVFIGLLVVLHLMLHLAFGIGPEAPDLLTPAALLAARRLRGAPAAALGFGLGVLDDALALTTFGASALALTAVCYAGARSRDLFEGESYLYLLVYLVVGKWLRDVIVFVVAPETVRADAATALLVVMPLFALYSAVVGGLALLIFRAASGERG